MSSSESPQGTVAAAGQYVVVARRYRPQLFEELVGQEHVAKALSNAIATQRVGHAYLFTGARGVGKTSAARILAKALNCSQGPSPVPCNQCDICQSVSSGDDVDVLEIDGASNRGIDEIRQLRQNVNVRPSRSRFKIYIIDEVHMLTREAFNALLKTLEEPPEHVKFIFCTTEAAKIPITILSRCQRFDFAGIRTASIGQRLRQIVDSEGVAAEPEALDTLARRAAGSMRDSQSLLEQILSFCPGKITLADVHGMLGTATDEALARIVEHLANRDAPGMLAALDATLLEGVDVGQLMEQLLGYLRDAMVAAAGCPPESFLYCSPSGSARLAEISARLGLQSILAAMQILDHTLARMKTSTQGRVLAELALVRISQLEDLDALADLVVYLQSGAAPIEAASRPVSPALPDRARAIPASAPGAPAKKNAEADFSLPAASLALTEENATQVWTTSVSRLQGMAANYAKSFEYVALRGPSHLLVVFKPGSATARAYCESPDQLPRFEQAVADVVGRRVKVEFAVKEDNGPAIHDRTARNATSHQRKLEVLQHPMVRRAGELFGAQPERIDEPTDRSQ